MIDEYQELRVNGSAQWVYLRGQSKGAILLFVHGGPGSPLVPIARGFEGPFLKDYLVIHWDQRGVGKSFQSTDFSQGFSLDQFVADGLSVARQIQSRYPDRPIILVGHSWGTVIGIRMAAAAPELFTAYISIGTNSHSMAAENYRYEVLEAAMLKESDSRELAELHRIGRPPWVSKRWEDWGTFAGKHIPHEQSWGQISVEKIEGSIRLCLAAGDYSEKELEDIFAEGLSQSFDHLADDYYSFSAIEQVPRLRIPIFFLQGSLDFNTPSHIAKRYFEALEAPSGKYWIEKEGCAHMIFYENPDAFLEVCRSIDHAENDTDPSP
ncbi:MAG: alpha/beta fold hydrolase [Verrucomicrobiales bacterium]